MMHSISSFGNLSTSSGVRSLRRPCPSRLRYCGITCASAKVCRTVIVDLTCTDISPDRAEKNSAETSSEQPIISWMSQLPMISDHRFFGYRFCNCPKLCTASITRISLDLTTESERAKSEPSSAPPIRPTLLNSSKIRLTGTGHRPPGCTSANLLSLINIQLKNRDERNDIVAS